MPHKALHAEILGIISRVLCVPVETLRETAHFRADLRADNLDMEDLRRTLEEELGIVLPVQAFDAVTVVGDAMAQAAVAHDSGLAELQALNRRIRAARSVA